MDARFGKPHWSATMQAHPNVLAQLSEVRKLYGAVAALDGIDLDVRPGASRTADLQHRPSTCRKSPRAVP